MQKRIMFYQASCSIRKDHHYHSTFVCPVAKVHFYQQFINWALRLILYCQDTFPFPNVYFHVWLCVWRVQGTVTQYSWLFDNYKTICILVLYEQYIHTVRTVCFYDLDYMYIQFIKNETCRLQSKLYNFNGKFIKIYLYTH